MLAKKIRSIVLAGHSNPSLAPDNGDLSEEINQAD
jgi:hypothetical protein